MLTTILMIFGILCMLVTILFGLMLLGFVPSEWFAKFLKKHTWAQIVFFITYLVGLGCALGIR